MTVIPVLRRLRKEDSKFEASLGYTSRFCVNQTKPNKTTTPTIKATNYTGFWSW